MKSSLLFSLLLLTLVSQGAASVVGITTTKLPNGTVGTAYSGVVKARGGCTPYKWKVLSGKLPAGVTDDASKNTTDLDFSGTPTKADSYTFTIQVTGCGGHISKESYTLVVQSAAEHVVSLNWKASKSHDIAGYNLYRGPDGESWTKINSGLIASTDYDDSTVSNGSTYYYSATSVNLEGEESKKTKAVKVSVPD